MTIRSLAADLDVAPMSLYRHVKNRDDLLDAVVERLLVRRWRPRSAPSDGMNWIIEAADKLRRLLVTYPAALHVYLSRAGGLSYGPETYGMHVGCASIGGRRR